MCLKFPINVFIMRLSCIFCFIRNKITVFIIVKINLMFESVFLILFVCIISFFRYCIWDESQWIMKKDKARSFCLTACWKVPFIFYKRGRSECVFWESASFRTLQITPQSLIYHFMRGKWIDLTASPCSSLGHKPTKPAQQTRQRKTTWPGVALPAI